MTDLGLPAPRWTRCAGWSGAAAALVIVGCGGVLAAVNLHRTAARLPVLSAGRGLDRAGMNLQDLALLRRLPDVDPSFTPETSRAFRQQVDALAARAADLDPAALEMGAARAVALADNGHTNIRGALAGRSLNSVRIRFGWFSDGLRVLQADASLTDLVGGRVIDIEGRTPAALTAALKPYVGGPANMARYLSVNLLASPQALHAAGLAAFPDRESLTVQTPDGATASRTVPAQPAAIAGASDQEHAPGRDLSPIPAPDQTGTWRHVLAGQATLPLYLRDPDIWYWRAYPQPDTVFVELRRLRNQGPTRLDRFLDGVVREATARKVRYAIVDLRSSPGGDDTLTSAFARRLPALLPKDGRLFIITGPGTFSAGIITTARLKVFARGRAIIVGESVGDRERFWAEGGTATLPNSGLRLRYATALRDLRAGCRLADILVCYWRNDLDGGPAGDLTPHPQTAVRFADYAAGRDPVMDLIATLKKEPDTHVEQ